MGCVSCDERDDGECDDAGGGVTLGMGDYYPDKKWISAESVRLTKRTREWKCAVRRDAGVVEQNRRMCALCVSESIVN